LQAVPSFDVNTAAISGCKKIHGWAGAYGRSLIVPSARGATWRTSPGSIIPLTDNKIFARDTILKFQTSLLVVQQKVMKMTLHKSKAIILRLVSNRNGVKNISEDSDCFHDESHFNRLFDIEIKRTKRSKKPFVLILINITGLKKSYTMLNKLQKVLSSDFRETDIRGWYKQESVIGIIFTELNSYGHDTREAIFGKTVVALNSQIDPDELRKIYITFHSYPKDLENSIGSGRFDLELDYDLTRKYSTSISSSRVRRLIDFVGSFLALIK
jgi:hypothetical protein